MRKPTLIPEWKRVARRAWSVRFNALGVVFSVAEAVLPLYSDKFPRGVFALLTVVVVSGGFISRFIFQPKMRGGDE